MKSTRPIWVDPSRPTYPVLTHDIDADVVVIGGGLAGIGAARWLQQRGVDRIVVLEQRTIASGATGRNAGFVMAVAPENFPPTDDPLDVEIARRIWKYTSLNQVLIEETIDELGVDAEYEKRGCLQMAASATEWEQTLKSADLARLSGLSVDLVPREDLPVPWLSQNYFGGAWFGDNAQMQPAKFVRGVARQLTKRGLRVFEGTKVQQIVPGSSSMVVVANAHKVQCTQIVAATNAYTSNWCAAMGKWIEPKRGQMLATYPLTDAPAPCPVYANDGYQYWRQTPDGRLVLGGWRDMDFDNEVGAVHSLNERIQSELERVAKHLTTGPLEVQYRWSGIMGFTRDRRPLVGLAPDNPNLAIAAGFSGHGLAMAFMASREAVEMLSGASSAFSDLFDPGRFEVQA